MKKRRFLGILFGLAMVWLLSLGMSTTALADGDVAQVGEDGYPTLAEAITAVTDGGTITLLQNVTLTEPLGMNKSYTLDFNSKTVSYNTTATTNINGSSTIIFKNGKLDISGCNISSSTDQGILMFKFASGSTLTFDKMELYGKNCRTYGIFSFPNNATAPTINFINESRIALENESNLDYSDVFKGLGSTYPYVINITDSTVSCTNVTRFSLYGTINVTNSTVTFTGGENAFRQGIFTFDNSTVTVSGAKEDEGKAISPRFADTKIKNHSTLVFTGSNISKDVCFEYANNIEVDETSTLTVSAVYGSANDRKIIAPEGYALLTTENEDNTTTYRAGYIAMIGDVGYASLADAVTAAQSGDVIDILADIKLDAVFLVGKSLTINGNGHKIENSANRIIRITDPNVELAINEWNLVSTCTAGSDERGISFDDASAGSKLTLNKCQLSAGFYAINAIPNANNLTIQVKDGTVAAGWAAFNLYSNNSTIIVDNSTLKGLNDKTENAWNNFNTITFDGNCLYGGTPGTNGSNNTLTINNSTVYASSQNANKQHWLGIQYGAKNITVKVDSQSRIIDSNGEDQTTNLLLGWYYDFKNSNWSYYNNESAVEVELDDNDTLYAVGGNAGVTLSDNSNFYFDLVYGDYYSSGPLEKKSYDEYAYRILLQAKLIEGFKEPAVREGLIYDEQKQELITAGIAPSGSFVYAFGNDATTAPADGWSDVIPTATNTGTYYVWYRIEGGAGHNSTAAKCVTATIGKADAVSATVAPNKLTYDGLEKPLLTVTGAAVGGTMVYAYNGSATTEPDAEAFTEKIPTATEVGSYPVWYMAAGDANHNSSAAKCVTATIAKADSVPATVTANDRTYDGTEKPLVTVTGEAVGGTMVYAYNGSATTEPAADAYTEKIPTATNAGTYPIWYMVLGDASHANSAAQCVTAKISKAAATVTANAQTVDVGGAIDTGVAQATLTGAVQGHALSAVTLTASGTAAATDKGTITPSAATIVDANKKDVTANYEITYVAGVLTVRQKAAGDIETETKAGEGAPKAKAEISDETAQGVATPEELKRVAEGETLLVYLDIENIDATVSEEDKVLVTAAATGKASGAQVGMYLDMSLFKKVGNDQPTKITELKTPIKVKIEIPENLRKAGRIFFIVRVHDGVAEIIAQGAGDAIDCDTNLFSTYALVYVDEAAPTAEPTAVPTAVPTVEPTAVPTVEPTVVPTVEPTATPTIEPTATPTPTPKPTAKPTIKPTPKPEPEPDFTLFAKLKSTGKRELKLTWTEVKGAKGYDIYFIACGTDWSYGKVDSVSAKKARAYKFKGLEKNTGYKAYVHAYKKVDGQKVYIGDASPVVHAFTGGSAKTKTNPAKVSVKRDSMKLVAGETGTIKASVTGVDPEKKLLTHAGLLRYYSSNRNVAKVNGDGKVTATGAGSCSIYAVATNGVRARVKVSVSSAPTKMSFGKSRYAVKVGKTLDLMAKLTVTPKGTVTTYIWESSAPKIAKVNKNGVVKALKKGKATITVTAANGKKAKVTVVVK